jgi:pyruvate/2-oxoglutarate dehydrogenase complex dihydrolipoamide acyltransferase (E2) component
MLNLKPSRVGSVVYMNQKIDVTDLVKYIEKRKKDKNDNITYFHAFMTALAKLVSNRPLLNRYIINGRFYDRNEIALSFVAKVKLDDSSEEYMAVIRVDKKDNINTIRDKIYKKVTQIRNNKKDDTDNIVSKVGSMPKLIRAIIAGIVKFMDKHDLLPLSMVKDNIYYSSILVSNLGSIDCGSIYHSLTDFGTNSVLITIGKIHKEQVIDNKGKIVIKDMCDFGVNIDERIADGVYFAKSLKLFEYIINNPKILEDKIDDKIDGAF